MEMQRIVRFEFFPANIDAGLLVLRIGVCGTLFLKHGLEKMLHYSQMAASMGHAVITIAMISDSICSLLIVLGLLTRWAALYSFANIFVAWAMVHHFLFFGRGADHGELIVLYLAALAAIVLAGPGKYSVDASVQG